MKKLLFFIMLIMTVALLGSCVLGTDDPADDKKTEEDFYKVMVAVDEGFKVNTTNPLEVKEGESAVFGITIDEGYVFSSVSAGSYD